MFLVSDAFRALDARQVERWDWTRTTILYVSYGWDPARHGAESIAGRRLVNAMLHAGAHVHVLASRRADVEWQSPNYTVTVVPAAALPACRVGRAVQMIRCGVPEAAGPWVAEAVTTGTALLSTLPADTIVYSRASPGSSNVVGWRLARLTRRPWVAHFSDNWPGVHTLGRGRRWLAPYKWPLFHLWRRRIIRDAGALTFTNPREARAFLGRAAARCADKTFVAASLPSTLSPRNTPPREGAFHIVHTGNLYRGQTASGLVQGIRLFLDRTPAARGRVRVTQAGWADGDMPRWVEACGLTDIVRFAGRVTPQQVLELVDEASLLIALDYARPDSVTMLSKLPDYVYAGRPILALTAPSSSLGRFFGEDGAGLTADYGSPDQVAERIGAVFEMWRHGRHEAFLPQRAAIESFDWQRVLSEVAGAFVVARGTMDAACRGPLRESVVAQS